MKRTIVAIALLAASIWSAEAAACNCVQTESEIFVADVVPSDFIGIGVDLAPINSSTDAYEITFERWDGDAWIGVDFSLDDGLLSPMESWSEGERYRIEVMPEYESFKNEAAFEIGPPLGVTELELEATATTEIVSDYYFDICDDSPVEVVVARVDLTLATRPDLESMLRVRQFVDGEEWLTWDSSCGPRLDAYPADAPWLGPAASCVLPQDGFEQGTHALRYEATLAGAPNVTIAAAEATVDLTCEPNGQDSGSPWTEGDDGQDGEDVQGADDDMEGNANEDGCSTAASAISAWPLLLVGLVWMRRRFHGVRPG